MRKREIDLQQTVIVERNQRECRPELLRDECLHQLVEKTADQFSHRIALICDHESMTYGELDLRANQLAFYLREKGVKRGSRVAILLERSFEQYIAILAIIKAGAAYVPLDPSYPEDRIAYILEDCQVAALVTSRSIQKEISSSCRRIYLDQEALEIEAQPTRRLLPSETGVGPTDLCYIIYTSGSTGRPKGVMIEHRNVCHFVRAAQTFTRSRLRIGSIKGLPLPLMLLLKKYGWLFRMEPHWLWVRLLLLKLVIYYQNC